MKAGPVLILLFLLLAGDLTAQRKIVFQKGLKRAVIKPGKEIGVTQKGEEYYFSNWTTSCIPCKHSGCVDSLQKAQGKQDTIRFFDATCIDSACYEYRWILDSIGTDYIVLRRWPLDSAKLRRDTVLTRDVYNYIDILEKQKKEYYWLKDVAPLPGVAGETISIFVVIAYYDRMRIGIDSISSFTFPEDDECNRVGIVYPVMIAGLMAAAPLFSKDEEGKFSWVSFAAIECVGTPMLCQAANAATDYKVKKYDVGEWKVKLK